LKERGKSIGDSLGKLRELMGLNMEGFGKVERGRDVRVWMRV